MTQETQFSPQDEAFMRLAIKAADKAQERGEVPVGAVLVKDGELICEGFNVSITEHNACGHAEIETIQKAGKTLENYRLTGTTLYVTLEPCAMCAGALLHARVERIVFGAFDPKAGACGSVLNLFTSELAFHYAKIEGGLLESECKAQIQNFFKMRRKQKKQAKQVAQQLEQQKKALDLQTKELEQQTKQIE